MGVRLRVRFSWTNGTTYGPNEKGWLEAKRTFFNNERVRKTMEEIEKSVGLFGARS